MPHALTCRNSHEWDSDAADARCPVCGSAAESREEGDSSTWDSGTGDELPPPPGAAARPLLADPIDQVPRLPGYEVLRELGRGGMGVVFEARHLALNRRVALKVIRGFAGREEVARFRAEANVVARLQHPNIVQIYSVGEHAGLPFLELEFVGGGSLAARLRQAPLPARAVAELVATLARAVQYAHSRGVIHRDLKPANILLAADPVDPDSGRPEDTADAGGFLSPKVGDFGLAKLGDDPGRSRSGLVIGTPAYMAPEQAAGRGDLVGPPADVWALGAILYECLTRRPPFLGSTATETVQLVLGSEPTPPTRLAAGVPRDLETICLKCLRKEPDERYRTAGDLADDLARHLHGRPILARRVPWWERLGKWARRKPAAAALILVSLAAGAALAGLGYRHYRNVERYNDELETKNTTISRNNLELSDRNERIQKQARDLELANAATIQERDRAEENLVGALEAVDGLLSSTGLAGIAHVPHIDRTRERLLTEALRVCDRLLGVQKGNPRLQLLQASTLQRSGHILRLLQRFQEASQKLDQALAILAGLRVNPGKFAVDDLLKIEALTRMSRGSVFLQTGEVTRATEEQQAALELLGGVLEAKPDDVDLRFLAAIGNTNLGIAALEARDNDGAALYLGRARQLTEDLVRQRPGEPAYAGVQALALNALGAVRSRENELARAEELFDQAIAIGRRLVAAFPGDVEYRQALSRALSNRGNVLRARGYLKRAAEPLAEARTMLQSLVQEHDDIGSLHVELAWNQYHTGLLHQSRGDFRAAEEWLTRGLTQLGSKPRLLEKDAQARSLAGTILETRAIARDQLHLYREAAEDLAGAARFLSADRQPALRIERARLLLAGGDRKRAVEELEAALARAKDLTADDHFAAGLILARAAAKDGHLARRAVEELARAAEAGYFRDPQRQSLLKTHPDFKPLHTRQDFLALQKRLEKR